MNRWAAFLAQTPPTLQRLIASSQRISLPRQCPAPVRLTRLRAALCRGATVRATYFALAPAERQALQQLRHLPRGLSLEDLVIRFGPIRPLADLRADRRPRSLSERLLLLGWLLPRPATRNHPTRYLLPPELRAWLPVPLPTEAGVMMDDAPPPTAGVTPTDPPPTTGAPPPALVAATAILVAAATAPLPLRADGRPTAAALRRIRPRLAPLAEAEADALCAWLLPLLGDLGLLAPHGAAVIAGPGAPRFLAAPAALRLRTLADTWVRAPRPDRWLTPLRVNTRGLDWPALRRRLRAWAAALPPGPPADPAASHALLHAALGPLADSVTHGFCAPRHRAPWLPRRAAAVWAAACRGPLAWLGELPVGRTTAADDCRPTATLMTADEQGFRVDINGHDAHHADGVSSTPPHLHIVRDRSGALPPAASDAPDGPGATGTTAPEPAAPVDPPRWRATADGTIWVPRCADAADLLILAPFARVTDSDAAGEGYMLSRASIAAAAACGHDPARLRAVLLRRCGSLPSDLVKVLTPAGGLRLCTRTVLLGDDPGDLALALGRRSARRAVEARLAPGVALVAPGREAALVRALARDGRVVAPPPPPTTPPPTDLTAGECAALLLAGAYYRAHAPADAPAGPDAALRDRLSAAMPPALGAATEVAIAALTAGDPPPAPAPAPLAAGPQPADPPSAAPPLAELLERLRATLRRRGALTLHYQGADETTPRTRVVRPLRLERHGPWWYLHAYCLLARAERCFRLDRVHGLAPADTHPALDPAAPGRARPASAAPPRRRAPRKPRSAPRVGFFAGPPAPPPGSPLVGVWLDEGSDQPVGRLGGDPADPEDRDPLHGVGVEPVAAYAVGIVVDQRAQLPAQLRQLDRAQLALEDAVLHPGPVALEQLHHLRPALVLDDVVADDREHVTVPSGV